MSADRSGAGDDPGGPPFVTSLEEYCGRREELLNDLAESGNRTTRGLSAVRLPSSSSDDDIEWLDAAAMAAPLPPLEYLVRELGLTAGPGVPHLFAGYGSAGKTMAVQSMLLSFAAGRPVWGVWPARRRRVAHIDLEQGKRVTLRRYQRLARAMGIDLASLEGYIKTASYPDLQLSPAYLERWLRLSEGIEAIGVDSLTAGSRGIDENSTEVGECLSLLGQVSERTGCRFIVLHHAKKPGPDGATNGKYIIRGSSAIFAATDGVYILSAEKGEPIKLEHERAREHGELMEDYSLVISDVEESGDPRAGLQVRVHGVELVAERREERVTAERLRSTERVADRVKEAIRAQPGITNSELRARLGLSGGKLAEALASLGAQVELREETRSGGGRAIHRHYVRALAY